MTLRVSSHVPLAAVTTSATQPPASAVTLPAGAPTNVINLSLNPGSYYVWGIVTFVLHGSTIIGEQIGISDITQAFVAEVGDSVIAPNPNMYWPFATNSTSGNHTMEVGPVIVTVTTPATLIFLVAQQNSSTGTVTAYGTLRASLISAP